MTEKTFQITASGHAFNLETFVTEKTVLHQGRPTITFESKNEFDQRLDAVLKRFFMTIEGHKEGSVELVIMYKSGQISGSLSKEKIHQYSRGDDRSELIDQITTLVRETEREIKSVASRLSRSY